MSIHKSLKLKGSMQRARNVLTRKERIAVMKERGEFKTVKSIYGLPKTRVR
ncbi:MAG: small basic protein [Planctomycetota bacterium]|jgi:small basic protein (TIGR04137 family)